MRGLIVSSLPRNIIALWQKNQTGGNEISVPIKTDSFGDTYFPPPWQNCQRNNDPRTWAWTTEEGWKVLLEHWTNNRNPVTIHTNSWNTELSQRLTFERTVCTWNVKTNGCDELKQIIQGGKNTLVSLVSLVNAVSFTKKKSTKKHTRTLCIKS